MYIPPAFAVTQPQDCLDLIQAYPLAQMVYQVDGLLDSTPLPVLLHFDSEKKKHVLQAHIARANPLYSQLKLLQNTQPLEVLFIFQAEQGYISPSDYASKQHNHLVVPTWNYRVVNVKGHMRCIEDERWLRGLLARLTRKHEQQQPQPWRMSDSPPEHLAHLLTQIVGIEIEIIDIQGKFKLSQNRIPSDQASAIEALQQRGETALAQVMQQYPSLNSK